MADSDSYPSKGQRSHQSGEHDVALDMIMRGLRSMNDKLDAMAERLSDGSTKMALLEQLTQHHHEEIKALHGRSQRNHERLDEVSDVIKAVACDSCEDRIEKLEKAEGNRIDREEQQAKRDAKQPPWWLVAGGSAVLSALGSAATYWIMSGLAQHMGSGK